MYRTELIDTFEAMLGLEQTWKQLLERSGGSTVFQTFQWHATWHRSVGMHDPALRLYLLAVYDSSTLRGLAPLAVQRRGESRALIFHTAPYTDYHTAIVDPDAAEPVLDTLWQTLRARRGDWDTLDLDEIPASSALCSYIQRRQPASLIPGMRIEPSTSCPRIDLTDVSAVAHATQKKEYLLKMRQLRRLGTLTCEHFFDTASIRARFPQFTELHTKQWRGRPDAVATFDDPYVEACFSDAVDTMAPDGLIMLTELRLDQRPISYYYSFVYNRTYWAYRTCFDVSLSRYSPGGVMLHFIIDHLHTRGFETLDFMRGGYGYKYRYASGEQQNHRLVVDSR